MRLQYADNVRIVAIPCTGKMDVKFLLTALENGADGVMGVGCLEGECHYLTGNLRARKRVERVKEILAFEVTAMVHGHQKAAEAYQAAVRQFGAADPDNRVKTSSAITSINLSDSTDSLPQTTLSKQELEKGVTLVELFLKTGLCASKGQARRLLQQGGGYCNDARVAADREITPDDFAGGQLMLRAGKKRYHRVVLAS